MTETVETTYECGECGKLSHDSSHVKEHWFDVDIPHRDIEKMNGITFCMHQAYFCDMLCFSAFGDRLVRISMTGTDRIGLVPS